MTNSGDWAKIAQVQSNDAILYLPLSESNLGSGTLQLTDANGTTIYHHFKAVAENFSGMTSTKEYILTLYHDGGGISSMIVEETLTVE